MNNPHRAAMVAAFSAFHLAGRTLEARTSRWRAEFHQVKKPIEELEEALSNRRRDDPLFDHRPEEDQRAKIDSEILNSGKTAYKACEKVHGTLDMLRSQRFKAFQDALKLMGRYHGGLMALEVRAEPGSPEWQQCYWRHARAMAKTLQSHIPRSRVVGADKSFDSTSGWAKALGMTPKNLVHFIESTGKPSVRVAGKQGK